MRDEEFVRPALLRARLRLAAPRVLRLALPERPLEVDRLARVDGVVGARVLTWPAGSHAAQMLAFYMPDTQFVRVVEEPRAVRTMTDAVGRGVFDFVVVDTASRERGSDVPPGLQMNYRRLFAITDEADLDAFEVWRRR